MTCLYSKDRFSCSEPGMPVPHCVRAAVRQHGVSFLPKCTLENRCAGVVQKLPTSSWSEQDMESVLSRAYMWRASFTNARSHLTQG